MTINTLSITDEDVIIFHNDETAEELYSIVLKDEQTCITDLGDGFWIESFRTRDATVIYCQLGRLTILGWYCGLSGCKECKTKV